jgi:hypothetical protein
MAIKPNPQSAKAVGDLLINLGIQLAVKVVPPLVKMATDAGIEALKGFFKQPEGCPANDKILELINIRNNILKVLNPTSKTLEALVKTLDVASTTLNITKNVVTISSQIIDAYILVAPKVVPPLPVPPNIFTTKANIDDTLNPILNSLTNRVNITNIAVNIVYNIVIKIIEVLNAIDLHINECSDPNNPPQLTPIDPFVQSVFDKYQESLTSQVDIYTAYNTTYNGFTLEIVTGSYAPTASSPKLVTSKAVGKNFGGIPIIETEYSFTTTPQVLIDELKLRIDTENLKAY